MVGSFLTGIFADSAISALDGATLAPGAWNGVGVQVGRQLADITSISSYSFVVSCILLFALKYTPFMGLRVSEEVEMKGLDIDQFFDEQIGDWSFFNDLDNKPLNGVREDGLVMSKEASMERGDQERGDQEKGELK
jgi:Amt family ammonium transporter